MTDMEQFKLGSRLNYRRYKRHFVVLQLRKKLAPTEASILINSISLLRELKSLYLEIGVERGNTLANVQMRKKIGVDPVFHFNPLVPSLTYKFYTLTSDDFFRKISNEGLVFDIIFLDGLHTFEQTYKDLANSFKFASINSIIIIDDTVPSDVHSSLPDQRACYESREKSGVAFDSTWNGDVFKVIFALATFKIPGIHWATLTDLTNPKTVIWFSQNEMNSLAELPELNPNLFIEYNYETCFKPKISAIMNPMSKEQLLQKLKLMPISANR